MYKNTNKRESLTTNRRVRRAVTAAVQCITRRPVNLFVTTPYVHVPNAAILCLHTGCTVSGYLP